MKKRFVFMLFIFFTPFMFVCNLSFASLVPRLESRPGKKQHLAVPPGITSVCDSRGDATCRVS